MARSYEVFLFNLSDFFHLIKVVVLDDESNGHNFNSDAVNIIGDITVSDFIEDVFCVMRNHQGCK